MSPVKITVTDTKDGVTHEVTVTNKTADVVAGSIRKNLEANYVKRSIPEPDPKEGKELEELAEALKPKGRNL